MVSKEAKESLEQARRMLVESVPLALQRFHEVVVDFIKDYHAAIEAGDQAKAGKVRRKLEKQARKIRKHVPAEVTAGAIRDLLNERGAPEEWHDLARQIFPGYDTGPDQNEETE